MALARQFSATPAVVLLLLAAAVCSAADYSYGEDYAPPKTEGGVDDHDGTTPLPTTLPIYEKPLPSSGEEAPPPLTIAVEGVVSCQSGSKYSPLKGVIARIACVALNEKGNEVAPFSFSSFPTDEHGYFLATLSPSKLKGKAKVTQCKVFLPPSSCEDCKYPTDINNGVTGALFRSFRILTNKKMKLYSVGPFFYTSKPNAFPIPDGY